MASFLSQMHHPQAQGGTLRMYTQNKLLISEITVEHMRAPLGIDCAAPRFAWKPL